MDLTTVFHLYLALFYPPGTEISEVEVAGDEYRAVQETYTSELEQGYCLFGHLHDNTAVVEDVVHTDYPVPWTHSKGRIDFTCIPELLHRLPVLLTHPDHQFIGAIHTHPSGRRLSQPDRFWFKATAAFQRIHGISDGQGISFYSHNSTTHPLPTEVVNTR